MDIRTALMLSTNQISTEDYISTEKSTWARIQDVTRRDGFGYIDSLFDSSVGVVRESMRFLAVACSKQIWFISRDRPNIMLRKDSVEEDKVRENGNITREFIRMADNIAVIKEKYNDVMYYVNKDRKPTVLDFSLTHAMGQLIKYNGLNMLATYYNGNMSSFTVHKATGLMSSEKVSLQLSKEAISAYKEYISKAGQMGKHVVEELKKRAGDYFY